MRRRTGSWPRVARCPVGLSRATATVFVLGFCAGTALGQGNAECLQCHADREAYVAPHKALGDSVHSDLDCTDCHASISLGERSVDVPNPHGARVEAVDCGECHGEQAEVYKEHGRLQVGADPDMPVCGSCHGAHDILPSSDRRSHTHPINLPDTCRACHTDVDLVKKHDVLRNVPIMMYENSVHGKAAHEGGYVKATCGDCHSARDEEGNRSAHRILSAADPEAPIFHFAIPDTCGKCHVTVRREYWAGIHGQLAKRGSVDAPVCTHCHGEHGIISPRDPRSPVSAARLAEKTCTPCHESPVLNQKYGDAEGRHTSYIDVYHGLKSKAGDVTVATCDSCHGSHRVLPADDPNSSIHADNLQFTCSECHEGISTEVAQTRIHQTVSDVPAGWPALFRRLYIVLIVVTIGGMLLHNFADWLRHVLRMGAGPFVQRLSINEVVQHWVLMLSFIVLVISGFSLRFSEAGWVKLLFGWEGGFEVRGMIHRTAAVIMTIGSLWHVCYLLTARGRQCLKDMMPKRSDIVDVWHNACYFVGRRSEEPSFRRFSYVEKAEYWSLVWGTAIMTATGLMLWFEDYLSTRWGLSKVVLDVALVIHYYEAWLAFLAILVWHIYGTVFKPSVYPMSPAWIAGKMPKEMYVHEHPQGPKLKARTLTVHYEDEGEEEEG